ncbi:hypothetical protein BLNAU_5691 [Blattamonas nauphoetae]|uniref:Uncharacterized protein n=1 Tax=Blattamonas nauphoetae TaxID=2049346 RepID=A0ABQ9Y6I7_9EUKA|nr:hypothetical protein BLNAU_5691 [Blattamonas nauphoetae]
MPFKDEAKLCLLKGCSQVVDDDYFNGYCSRRHEDVAKLQLEAPYIEQPTPLTSIPLTSEGSSWKRAGYMPTRRGYNYAAPKDANPSFEMHKKIYRVTSSGLYLRDDPVNGGSQAVYGFRTEEPINEEPKTLKPVYGGDPKLNKTCTRQFF